MLTSHLPAALLMDFLNTPEKKERRLVHLPMGRFGEAVEIAKAALFCMSKSILHHTLPFVTDISTISGDGREQLYDGMCSLQCSKKVYH